jgi:cell division protein FtsQ
VLIGVTVVAALGGGGWVATNSALLDVDHIAIVGAVHTPANEVAAAAHLRRGERMVDVQLGPSARGVEALPWVGRATVERQWPGRVRISITERTPAAATPGQDGGVVLVDATGRVLDRVDTAPAGLPVLAGLPPAGPAGSTLSADGVAAVTVAVALPPDVRTRTAAVGPVGGTTGEVELRLTPDGTVRLGPPDDLAAKFDAIRAVLAQVDLRNLAVLDVRVPDSPILTRRDVPTKVSTPRAG